MSNKNQTGNKQATPNSDAQVTGGGESRHSQHQWIVQSFNEMKAETRHVNERIDQVYGHISDAKNDSSLACAVSRMEATLQGIEKKIGALDNISGTLNDHSIKLSGLSDIGKKLDTLDDIEKTITKTKIMIGVGTVVLVACAGASWFIFGNYLTKIIEALNTLVLK